MESGIVLEELDRKKPVHLVGIGGAGMSAVATVLLEMGFRVEGSDIKESRNTRRLRGKGAVIGVGHRRDNVGRPSVVVKSSAVRDDNPELLAAVEKGIPVVTRAEMLGAVMGTGRAIAVAGTHGKTTTAALMAQMLMNCGKQPSFLVGGDLNEIGSNARYDRGEFLVAEADESDGSLLSLRLEVAVLTNVDIDHHDYYRDLDHTSEVFSGFLGLVPSGGFAVVCGDDPRALEVGRSFQQGGGELILYGSGEQNQYRFDRVEISGPGSAFDVWYQGRRLGRARVGIPGIHNASNALAAIATGHRLGLPEGDLLKSMADFGGVHRRFETVGMSGTILVIDDYAHHPTEVRAVLELASTLAESRVVAVFQPHRYSRTASLARAFGESFRKAGVVVISDVYGAEEEPEPGITGELVVDYTRECYPDKEVHYVPERSRLAREVCSVLQEGDMVLTMGAGDITQCAREVLEILEGHG